MSHAVSSADEEQNGSFMYKLAAFIVDKRNLFFLLFIFALIFSVFAKDWVNVENDITKYLADDTETRRSLTIMDEEFVTYGTADLMVANVTYDTAEKLAEQIENINGVTSVAFDDTEEHYKTTYAMFSVTFDGEEADEISVTAMNGIKELLADYDVYYSTAVGVDPGAQLAEEMKVIIVIAAVIILLVVLFTSKAYAEIPVLVMTFGATAVLNMGTNFMLGFRFGNDCPTACPCHRLCNNSHSPLQRGTRASPCKRSLHCRFEQGYPRNFLQQSYHNFWTYCADVYEIRYRRRPWCCAYKGDIFQPFVGGQL